MTIPSGARPLMRWLAVLVCALAPGHPGWASVSSAPHAASAPAARLLQEFEAKRERLENSPYGRPLTLDSREFRHHVEGDAYAVFSHPFARVAEGLAPAAHWCEILLLPFNTKHCQVEGGSAMPELVLFVGRRNDTPVREAYRLRFGYEVAARGADYLKLTLRSEDGPLGTRDYRIALEAAPLAGGRTFVKLTYSYGYGTLTRLMMQAYLAAFSDKVGFSVEGRDREGRPRFVRGMRGVMERNTMRYALAIDAYLASLEAPPGERVARRLDAWFTATERYPRQLHEIGRDEYLGMKRQEYARMHSGACCRVASSR